MTNQVIANMLAGYRCRSDADYVNAIREIMQVIALRALSRKGFFSRAAFYGGTALRVLYGLDRGSEDLDFSLIEPDDRFELDQYSDCLTSEFASFGMTVGFSEKAKISPGNIKSGFLKTNTRAQFLSVGLDEVLAARIHAKQELRIKIEVDIQPPPGFDTEVKYLYQPLPFAVRSYVLSDLLAGKLHAVLFREWKSRMKGRDWYDLVWYAGYHPKYHLLHLEWRSIQSGHYDGASPLTEAEVRSRLSQRLEQVDMEQLKDDVRPFLRDPSVLDIWSKDFFRDVFGRLTAI